VEFTQGFLGLTHKVLQAGEEEGTLPAGTAGTPLNSQQAQQQVREPLLAGLKRLETCLKLLATMGHLSRKTQLGLLLTYVVAVPVRRLRGLWAPPEVTKKFDDHVRTVLEEILKCRLTSDQWARASLPLKMGGLGMSTTEERAAPAFLGSWAACASEAAAALRLKTAEHFREAARGAVKSRSAKKPANDSRREKRKEQQRLGKTGWTDLRKVFSALCSRRTKKHERSNC
jgi:hypothetical protein